MEKDTIKKKERKRGPGKAVSEEEGGNRRHIYVCGLGKKLEYKRNN